MDPCRRPAVPVYRHSLRQRVFQYAWTPRSFCSGEKAPERKTGPSPAGVRPMGVTEERKGGEEERVYKEMGEDAQILAESMFRRSGCGIWPLGVEG